MGFDLSLCRLADIVGIPLTLTGNVVQGERAGSLSTSLGASLPLPLRVVKHFANAQVGVLVHVCGDLYLLASHYPQTGSLSLYIVDGGFFKTPVDKLFSTTANMIDVYAAMKGGIVSAFSWRSGKWKPLTLPA